MQMSFSPPVERLARRFFPGQVATKLVPPEPYEHDTFTLEATNCASSNRAAPIVQIRRLYTFRRSTTPESRKNWVAALDRLAALKPESVVAGHKKPGAPDSPSTIQDTKRYLLDFDRLQQTAASDEELFNQMTELYLHWAANQSWLMLGSRAADVSARSGMIGIGVVNEQRTNRTEEL